MNGGRAPLITFIIISGNGCSSTPKHSVHLGGWYSTGGSRIPQVSSLLVLSASVSRISMK